MKTQSKLPGNIGRTIAHITLQQYDSDARVLRAVQALEAAGYSCPVVAPGLGFDLPNYSVAYKARIALTFGSAARLGKLMAERAFFALPHHRAAVEALVMLSPDAIHAHDWDGLLVARRAAQILQIPYSYDSHELAGHMHGDRVIWAATIRPLIRLLEGEAARDAVFVVAVGELHARELKRFLGIDSLCVVVRNISQLSALNVLPMRAENAPILLHYHGALAGGRGLETAIDALALLPQHFVLRLTGPWRQAGLERKLRSRLERKGLRERVRLKASMPHEQLVSHASEADIGLCLLTGGSRHNAIALPNKIFDYLKAGIVVTTYGMKDVGFLQNAGAGIILADDLPKTLASALASLDRSRIDAMRVNALHLAKLHHWNGDALILVRAWNDVGIAG
jgi:glycosyltransferase involved in cell wall biosynthesis